MARRTNYVTQQLRLTNAAIQAQQQQKLNQILPAQMTQAGYVCLDQQNQELFTPDVWQARDQYFQNALQEARAAIATRLRPAIEKRIFSENGFRYYENRKEWRPKGVLHQIKTFFAD